MTSNTQIKPIDKTSVHRICSGQVILNLSTAIKELVENSLDAGATSVEVRVKDHGKDSIEVMDNGRGVEEDNLTGLTLKHHTSKLRDFSDLTAVGTFGFRGEALSSMCALGKMMITTRHIASQVGWKLEYDHNGVITKRSPFPRQSGTTVTVQNLFSTLPVRHKEFVRNVKKEFAKMVNVLTAYCLVSTGVRIQCIHLTDKGRRSVVLSTNSNRSVRENITNIFGPKQVDSVSEFEQYSPSSDVCDEMNTKIPDAELLPFKIEGYISHCEHGKGRSCSDRQFLFVNSRPCDLNKLTRIINDVYHTYNRHQYPFVMLNISLNKECVDVNVTPDKRQVFMENEKLLFAIVKTSLVRMFEPQSSSYRLQLLTPVAPTGHGLSTSPFTTPTLASTPSVSSVSNLKRNFSSAFASPSSHGNSSYGNSPSSINEKMTQASLNAFVETSKRAKTIYEEEETVELDLSLSPEKNIDESVSPIKSTPMCESKIINNLEDRMHSRTLSTHISTDSERILEFHKPSCHGDYSDAAINQRDVSSEQISFHGDGDNNFGRHSNLDEMSCNMVETEDFDDEKSFELGKTVSGQKINFDEKIARTSGNSSTANDKMSTCGNTDVALVFSNSNSNDNNYQKNVEPNSQVDVTAPCHEARLLSDDVAVWSDGCHSNEEAIDDERNGCQGNNGIGGGSNGCHDNDEGIANDERSGCQGNEQVFHDGMNGCHGYDKTCYDGNEENSNEYDEDLNISDRRVKESQFSMQTLRERYCQRKYRKEQIRAEEGRNFRAAITPGDNSQAEDELSKQISKEMFKDMQVLGQFNLGFIIARLNNDLFIIDQHATDEKYNFETLQRTTTLEGQKMIRPQDLELSVVNESLLLDNLPVFVKNGFDFSVDEEALCTQKVKLISTPVSRNWVFGKADIEEMLFMLSESPGIMCRPSRVRAMFASRSCRKSVMIGTALTKKEMTKMLVHMSEIDQPWNCPHGRPTMRHLVNLSMISR